MTVIRLDTRRITDWKTFHDVFAEVFGFPDFYGKNSNAWIDCMTDLDDVEGRMTSVHVNPGEVMVLQLNDVEGFMQRCPDQYAEIVECSAFVNWRRIEMGGTPVIALSFFKQA